VFDAVEEALGKIEAKRAADRGETHADQASPA
jgi:hypothetical protein